MVDNLSNNMGRQVVQKKELPKRVDPIVGDREVVEEGLITKMVKSFIVVDAKTAGKVVYKQVIEPGLKRMLIMAVNSGLSTMLNTPVNINPNAVSSIFNSSSSSISWTGYSAASTNPAKVIDEVVNPKPMPAIKRYGTFEYDNDAQAKDVIDHMRDLAETYSGYVTVGHLCQYSNKQDTPTDYDWGWTTEMVCRAKPYVDYDGKVRISWPNPTPIDKN